MQQHYHKAYYTFAFSLVVACVLLWRGTVPWNVMLKSTSGRNTDHAAVTDYGRTELPLPSIPNMDRMPFHEYIKSRKQLQNAEWVRKLHRFLQTLDKSISPQVNMVFGDVNHTHLVWNWLTAALTVLHPPLHNVMVLSLDHSLCDFLTSRGLPLTCIAVPVTSIFTLEAGHGWRAGVLVRFPVLRLINYWGYDVAAYDCDAVLLRNPQQLYEDKPHVDVFAAAGTFPQAVSRKWGFTLCGGTLVFRASHAVEVLWNSISAEPIVHSDQAYLNSALYKMDMTDTWQARTNVSKICTVEDGWEGGNGINIFVFPQDKFCRMCCTPDMSFESLYLVHPMSDKRNLNTKMNKLQSMGAWFLTKEDEWNIINSKMSIHSHIT